MTPDWPACLSGLGWEVPVTVRVVTFALVILLLLPGLLAAEARKSGLLVFDEDKDFPGLAIVNRSLRETFRSELKSDVEFYSESLNLSQFRVQGHDVVLRDSFRRKYAGTRLDLIVAVMGPSLDFLHSTQTGRLEPRRQRCRGHCPHRGRPTRDPDRRQPAHGGAHRHRDL